MRKPALRDRGAGVLESFSFSRILLHAQQLARRCHRFVVVSSEGIRRRKEMDIMRMVQIAIKRISAHISALIHGGGIERLNSFIPFACLRPHVTRHVKRMRNVRDELGVSPATRPCIFGEVGSLPTVNYIVMHSGMIRRFDE